MAEKLTEVKKMETIDKVLAYLVILTNTMGKLQEFVAILKPARDAKRELTDAENARLDALMDREMARLHAANQLPEPPVASMRRDEA